MFECGGPWPDTMDNGRWEVLVGYFAGMKNSMYADVCCVMVMARRGCTIAKIHVKQ